MSGDTVLFLILGAAAGGFINGLSGSGTALFALGFFLLVLDPVTAVALVALLAVLAGLQGMWVVRHEIFTKPKRLLRFILPGLIGVPLGVMLLSIIDASFLRYAIAALLILFGAYFGFRSALPKFSRPTPWLDSGIGLTGGILGGSAGLSGAVPMLYLSLRPWPKSETRAVLQPFNMALLCTTVVLLFFKGAYDATAVKALMVTIPAGLIATQIGIFVFKRLSDAAFRRLLILFNLVMGLGILISEVVG
ncbi:MAG: sulfite exporter TauE/SafE family protein [Pseudomonadota bacterium]